MTRIDFYSPVPNVYRVLTRLLDKAAEAGQRVLLWVNNDEAARQLDDRLWVADPLRFIPHCLLRAPHAAQTPVLIGHAGFLMDHPLPHDEILINLSDETPTPFAQFQRLIELVGTSDAQRLRCRARYRDYQQQGYPLRHHCLGVSVP